MDGVKHKGTTLHLPKNLVCVRLCLNNQLLQQYKSKIIGS